MNKNKKDKTKKNWHKPVICVITAKELKDFIKAAATSVNPCKATNTR